MLTTFRSAVAAAVLAGALVAPVAMATDAAAATCARHTTGVCKANSPHPRRATAKCKDDTWSYSAHARGTCSHHRGVKVLVPLSSNCTEPPGRVPRPGLRAAVSVCRT
ncbi:DUF3761 domain-containing protein [Streptomyces rhizosphaerihabitans]|uniref:DUF3761 domain-containing protein n=1 Tax=Streptomyces rhizosphaerihabitans TaxID=1266770 RepID=UPI0021C0027B|nr:DUF3761 domain-containing protein [Streptomyces rhizosphaerihabitans]MCT9011722.1 DUF3761 domain-containing protein [Streptomyces rhizosphaerihabitans]